MCCNNTNNNNKIKYFSQWWCYHCLNFTYKSIWSLPELSLHTNNNGMARNQELLTKRTKSTFNKIYVTPITQSLPPSQKDNNCGYCLFI